MYPDLQYHAVPEVAEEHPASNGNVGVGRALCGSSSLKLSWWVEDFVDQILQ